MTPPSEPYAVVDGLLGREVYGALLAEALVEPWRLGGVAAGIRSAWRLRDGQPWVGRPRRRGAAEGPFALFFEAVVEAAARHERVVGGPRGAWDALAATPFLHPPATSISPHVDGPRSYGGSFVYFLNPEWHVHWGGLLLVFSSEAKLAERAVDSPLARSGALPAGGAPALRGPLGPALEDPTGVMTGILPRPDRLVLLRPDVVHHVTPVHEAAGENHRLTVAGFFPRAEPV